MRLIGNIFEIIYGLSGILLSCAGLSFFSLIFYFIIGFFSGFSAEQWEFWFWVAMLWPLFVGFGAIYFGRYQSYKEDQS